MNPFSVIVVFLCVYVANGGVLSKIQSVSSSEKFDSVLNKQHVFTLKLFVGIIGFDDEFLEADLDRLLNSHLSSRTPYINFSGNFTKSHSSYSITYELLRLPNHFLVQYGDAVKSIMESSFEEKENCVIEMDRPSSYMIDVRHRRLTGVMDAIAEEMESRVLSQNKGRKKSRTSIDPFIVVVNPQKLKMLPSNDKNCALNYFNYYFYNKNENTIANTFIRHDYMIIVDVQAGPIIATSDLEDNNIDNPLYYGFCLDSSMKLNEVGILVKRIVDNVLLPNVDFLCQYFTKDNLLLPLSYFVYPLTIKDDRNITRIEQELRATVNKINSFENEHFSGLRVKTTHNLVDVQENSELSYLIRSCVIDTSTLVYSSNSISQKIVKQIDGQKLLRILKIYTEKWRTTLQNEVKEDHDELPVFVLDINDDIATFRENRIYYYNTEGVIVLHSHVSFPRDFHTDPNFKSDGYRGENTVNYVMSALFEILAGMESFNRVSQQREGGGVFMNVIGSHPFQFNNIITISKVFQTVHKRNSEIMMIENLIHHACTVYDTLNNALRALVDSPFPDAIMIDQVALLNFYNNHYYSLIEKYRYHFSELVALVNRLDNWCSKLKEVVNRDSTENAPLSWKDGRIERKKLVAIHEEIEELYDDVVETILENEKSQACCSVYHFVRATSDISIQIMILVVVVCLIVGVVLYVLIRK